MKNFSVKTADFDSLSISGESPIVQSDLGIAPNQIPLNKDLGSLAYMNAPEIEDLNVDTLELREIAAEMSETAVDVFVYDTRKDSDGGAWRSRTQHTSWYNEELNTATRGGRREFPAVAVIVAEASKVTIYDGDDPDLNMWMVFEQGGSTAGTANLIGPTQASSTSVFMLNGIILITEDTWGAGLISANFVSEGFIHYWQASKNYNGNISQRNDSVGYSTGDNEVIINGNGNDVAMTVLPNAPIDTETGLPIPTIAVATDGGVSVIRDDGSVVGLTEGSNAFTNIFFINNRIACWCKSTTNTVNAWAVSNVSIDNFSADQATIVSNNSLFDRLTTPKSSNPSYVAGDSELHIGGVYNRGWIGSKASSLSSAYAQNDTFSSDPNNITRGGLNILTDSLGLSSVITSTYNTGWMPGDIKLATLSETKIEKVGVDESTELINLNDGYADGGSWTINSNTQVSTTTSTDALNYYRTGLTTQTGKKYTATLTITNYTGSGDLGVASLVSGAIGSNLRLSANGTITIQFNGSNEEISLFYRSTNTATIEISIKETGELITNGTFDNGTTGWTNDGMATFEVSSAQAYSGANSLHVVADSNTDGVYQNFAVESGKDYVFTAAVYQATTAAYRIRIGDVDSGSSLYSANVVEAHNGTWKIYNIKFTAAGTTAQLLFAETTTADACDLYIDAVSVRLAEPDRSVNDNGLQIFGEIEKTPVAPGADLVAYSGFSAENYLMQPYNPDLDFGTGDFSIITWLNKNSTDTQAILNSGDGSTSRLFMYISSGNQLRFVAGDAGTNAYGSIESDSVWNQITIVRKGGIVYGYINGILQASYSNPETVTHSSNDEFRIGLTVSGLYPFGGSLSLIRFTATSITPEQIAKIYRDEKPLFQDGAQATLYGTSDAVTALAYDDSDDLLHVGTASGRSFFNGLKRVDNTTTAVSTAISATEGLVIEQ